MSASGSWQMVDAGALCEGGPTCQGGLGPGGPTQPLTVSCCPWRPLQDAGISKARGTSLLPWTTTWVVPEAALEVALGGIRVGLTHPAWNSPPRWFLAQWVCRRRGRCAGRSCPALVGGACSWEGGDSAEAGCSQSQAPTGAGGRWWVRVPLLGAAPLTRLTG